MNKKCPFKNTIKCELSDLGECKLNFKENIYVLPHEEDTYCIALRKNKIAKVLKTNSNGIREQIKKGKVAKELRDSIDCTIKLLN